LPSRVHLLALILSCVATQAVQAQRDLHWRSIAVEARLDSIGRLHVRERQEMVFTGDWNGGERSFNIRLGQKLTLERMLRVDPATGAEVEMTKGDLDQLHNYDWSGNNTLRWRSRQPSDPPFENTPLTFILEYSLANILVARDSAYVLSHDFAFSDRVGTIAQFTLALTLDEAWRAPPSFTGSYGPVNLPPGDGFVVTVPLEYRRGGVPPGVALGASPSQGKTLAGLLVAAVLILGLRFIVIERASGRFAPLLPADSIDEAWLKANVFNLLPEVVGAAWDDTTGAPEVTAVLARMVAEKKLASRVETKKVLIFTRNVLYLSLLVPRSDLSGYELALVDALFTPGSTETDTEQVKERYKSTGFDPAKMIKEPIEDRVKELGGRASTVTKPSKWPTLILLASAIGLMVLAGRKNAVDALWAGLTGLGLLAVFIFSVIQAGLWRNRVRGAAGHSLRFLIPMAVGSGGLVALMMSRQYPIGVLALAALVVWSIALWNSIFNVARTRQAPELIALRKRLASARDYFQRQLRQANPSLKDDWFPYLMAFGLGPHMDKWFKAFSGPTTAVGRMATSRSSGGGFSSGRSESWTGMGGGGGFAGGGSSGAWAAAAGGMAAGVSKPSSSSSGSSSSGGSSGGGGGGGW
jgi:uncharacterized membrane protein YgcG